MIRRTLGSLAGALALALVIAFPAAATAQIAVTQSVSGPTITLSWSPVANADAYVVQAGLAPGAYLLPLPASPTGWAQNAPAVGTYHLNVVALQGGNPIAQSGNIAVTVTSLVAPPAPPAGVEAFVYCGNVLLRWQPGANAAGYLVNVSGPVSGTVPTTGVSLSAGNPPPGQYSFTVSTVSGGAVSAPSAPVAFEVGGAGAQVVPTPIISQSIFGGYVSLRWAPVPGAASYTIAASQDGNQVLSQAVPAGVTSVSRFGVGFGNYTFSVVANTTCGLQSPTATTNFVVDESSAKMTPRAPDPTGDLRVNYLRLPYRFSVVQEVARQYPQDLRDSCAPGNHRFLYRVVERLRREDKRWGLNWKRGNFGDMSHDVINYNYGPEGDEGTRLTHVVDIISGHCGPNPGPAWIDQTQLFSTGAVWTLLPYIQAGYTP
jgi:hypothetical protein